jgi:ALTTAQ repeat
VDAFETVDLHALNTYVSRLTLEQIDALTDDEIRALSVERPGHPGQRGFLLDPYYFRSVEHMAETMHGLMARLAKADGQN